MKKIFRIIKIYEHVTRSLSIMNFTKTLKNPTINDSCEVHNHVSFGS